MYNRVRRTVGKEAKIFGVCAGLSRYIDPEADPLIMRLVFVLMGLFSGVLPMAFVYLILSMVLKRETHEDPKD